MSNPEMMRGMMNFANMFTGNGNGNGNGNDNGNGNGNGGFDLGNMMRTFQQAMGQNNSNNQESSEKDNSSSGI